MKWFFWMGLLCHMGAAQTVFGGWKAEIHSIFGTTHLQAVRAMGAQTVLVAGSDSIFRSTDAGQTWTVQRLSPLPDSGRQTLITSLFFRDSLQGWAAGGSQAVYRTTDGGITWLPGKGGILTDMWTNSTYFPTSDTGYAMGRQAGRPLILKTLNGGMDWITSLLLTETQDRFAEFSTAYFLDARRGYAVGRDKTLLFYTTNGGSNWSRFSNQTIEVESLFFLNDSVGFFSGYGSNGSDDGGVIGDMAKLFTADTIPRLATRFFQYGIGPVRSLYFTDSLTGYAVGERGIYEIYDRYKERFLPSYFKTVDGGLSWVRLTGPEPPDHVLSSVSFAGKNDGYAVGNKGFFIRYDPTIPISIRSPAGSTRGSSSVSQREGYLYYTLPTITPVKIAIYEAQGRRVAVLKNAIEAAGKYSLQLPPSSSSAVLFLRFTTPGLQETWKMPPRF